MVETYILPVVLIAYTLGIIIYTNKTYSKREEEI